MDVCPSPYRFLINKHHWVSLAHYASSWSHFLKSGRSRRHLCNHLTAVFARVDMELQARKNHGTPRPRNGENSTAMFGGKTKSHLYCAILPQAQVQIVRLSLDFLHQIYIYIYIYIYRSAGCPQHLFSFHKHLLILLLHLKAQLLQLLWCRDLANAVVHITYLVHRAMNTRKFCNDTQIHSEAELSVSMTNVQTRARNLKVNDWWFRNDLHFPAIEFQWCLTKPPVTWSKCYQSAK